MLTAKLGEVLAGKLGIAVSPKKHSCSACVKKDAALRRLRISNYRLSQAKYKLQCRLKIVIGDEPRGKYWRRTKENAKGNCIGCGKIREESRANRSTCEACAARNRATAKISAERNRHACADCPTIVSVDSKRCRSCASKYWNRQHKAVSEGKWATPL